MEEAENGVSSKLSLSPTRPPSSLEQTQKPSISPPSPPPPRRVPSWLILDRIVHRSSRRRCGAVPDDATASALALDLFDRPVRASLRIADPPSVSRLYLHLPGRPAIKRGFEEPKAIAAHRNSILFRLTVPFDDSNWWHDTVSFPDDYFVYSCRLSSSPSSPSSPASLTRLPTCFHGGTTCPELDKLYEPHRRQQQRAMFEEEIGILSHGDDDDDVGVSFTVAQLNFSGPDEFELCVLHRPPRGPAGTSMEWSVKEVQKPPNMKTSAYTWRTDIVVPIGRRCLCWVDNYQGLLLVDVVDFLADSKSNNTDHHQPWLRYIPLPSKALKSRRLYKDGGSLDPLRRVSVTDAGVVKLVCILTKRPPSPYRFTIRTWTLDDVEEGKWLMDVENTMGAEEFFSLLGTAGHSCLPRVQPTFPLVSLVDPDVIYFLLDERDCGRFWMVEVNMRNKQLQSSTLYISEEEEEDGYPPKRGLRNKFSGHQFIPSKFSSYLPEDAITSRELSDTMQKSKESRVMQMI